MKLPLTFLMITITACMPQKIEHCIQDDTTGQCKTEIVIKQVITVELPAALINDCIARNDSLPEPARTAAISACNAKYIQDITNLIAQLVPAK